MSMTGMGGKDAANAIWFGPYRNSAGVRMHVDSFLALAFPRYAGRLGIVWRDPAGRAVCVRQPVYDKEGNGLSLVLAWHGAPKPPPQQHLSRTETVESAIGRFFDDIGKSFDKGMAAVGQAQIAEAQAEMAAGKAIYRSVHNLVADHPAIAATVAVGLDVMGVAASGATVVAAGLATIGATGSFLGIAADAVTVPTFTTALASTAASLALLYADTRDLGLQLVGDKVQVDEYEHSTGHLWIERYAPLVALLDPGREAFQGMRAKSLLPAAKADLAAARSASAEADASARRAQSALNTAMARDTRVNAYLDKPGHVSTPVADDAARMKSAARVTAGREQAQATRVAAQKAAQRLKSLQHKAHELQDEFDKWWRWQWHAQKASGPRDIVTTSVAMGAWGVNNPFAGNFGEHDAGAPLMTRSHAAVRSLLGPAAGHGVVSMNVIASHRKDRGSGQAAR